MAMRALLLLAVAAVASSASIGSQTCCGPAEWEALAVASAAYGAAKSQSMSGRLSVDHQRKLATLYLLKSKADSNTSMTISLNDSNVFIYFIIHREQQPESTPLCAAYVLRKVVSDISSSCFPTDHSSRIDQLGSLPVNLLAYEYGGLAGLLAVQLYANAADCSANMLGLSAGSNDGPRLGIMLSDVRSGVSDRSLLDDPPSLCALATPYEIQIPSGGFGDRRGSSRGSSDWIDDLVMLYIIQQIRTPHAEPRSRRDLKDVLVHHVRDDQSDMAQVVQSAVALKQLLKHFSDFVGPIDDHRGLGNLRPNFDQSDIEAIAEFLIKRNLVPAVRPIGGRDDDKRNDDSRRPVDQSDLEALLALMVERNLIDRLRPEQDTEDQLKQLASVLAKLQTIGDAADLAQDILKYKLVANADSRRGPDLGQLLRLAACRAIVQSWGPHVTPIKLIGAQKHKDDDSGFSKLLKLLAAQQKRDDGPDFSDLLKVLAAQQKRDDGPDFSDLLKVLAAQQKQDDGPDFSDLLKVLAAQQKRDDGPDFSDLLKVLAIQQHHGGDSSDNDSFDLSTLLKLLALQQKQDDGPDFSDLLKVLAIQQHHGGDSSDDDSSHLSKLLKALAARKHH